MTNLSEFRNNELTQYEFALATGRTVNSLIKRSEKLHGNTQFGSFLYDTQATSSPINWLEYEQSFNAGITGIKQASRKIADLEDSIGLSVLEIINGLKRRHGNTKIGIIFDDLYCDYWSNVTKTEVISLLKEYVFWLDLLSNEFDTFSDINSAKGLLERLEQPVFKQLKRIADVIYIEQENWSLDSKVFNSILKGVSENNKEFVQEWLSSPNLSSHYNAKSHREYSSVYSFLFLSLFAQSYGLKSNLWATEKEWKKLGCQLKPAAKPVVVFHYFKVNSEKLLDSNSQEQSGSFGRKVSIVYNAEYVMGYGGESFANSKVTDIELVKQRIEKLSVHIKHCDGNSQEAFYSQQSDSIIMPSKEWFKGKDATKAYYATLLHEIVHWTGHESRCNRKFGKEFGDADYVFEELVAEIGSSFLCARFGLTKSVRAKSIHYIASWLESMNPDEVALMLEKASVLANRASNYIYIPPKRTK